MASTTRPPAADLVQRWKTLFADPLLSVSRLREHALMGDVEPDALRSVYWRVFLGQLPPPASLTGFASPSQPASWPLALDQSRSEWGALQNQFLRGPDGNWVDDALANAEDAALGTKKATASLPLGVNNPLSQDEGNPWKQWLEDLELRATIRQDVLRTFPDIDYFRQDYVQDSMTNILHVWAKLNEDVGYRQGMHELLAPILQVIDLDSISLPPHAMTEYVVYKTLSRTHVEHDSYAVFSSLMRACKSDYDFNASVPIPINSPSVPSRASFAEAPPLNRYTMSPQISSAKLVQPLVDKCLRIFDTHLRQVDPSLWAHLDSMQIEPQLWGIRWIRLLFTREFCSSNFEDAMKLWDGLFASDSSLRLVEHICVALLLRARQSLMASDYSNSLQTLLHYPSPRDGKGNRIPLLIRQALYLRDHPNTQAGIEVRRQNVDLGAEVGDAYNDDDDLLPTHTYQYKQNSSTSPLPVGLNVPGIGDVGEIAKGVYERAEALGLPRAFNSALTEFRKGYATSSPSASNDHPPLQQRSKSQQKLVSDFSSLRTSNLAISDALGTCVRVMEKDLMNNNTSHREEDVESRWSIVTALKHIQEVLKSGGQQMFDESVMEPVEEMDRKLKRRNSFSKSLSTTTTTTTSTTMTTTVDQNSDLINFSDEVGTSTIPLPSTRHTNLTHSLPLPLSPPLSSTASFSKPTLFTPQPRTHSDQSKRDRATSSTSSSNKLSLGGFGNLFETSSPASSSKDDPVHAHSHSTKKSSRSGSLTSTVAGTTIGLESTSWKSSLRSAKLSVSWGDGRRRRETPEPDPLGVWSS